MMIFKHARDTSLKTIQSFLCTSWSNVNLQNRAKGEIALKPDAPFIFISREARFRINRWFRMHCSPTIDSYWQFAHGRNWSFGREFLSRIIRVNPLGRARERVELDPDHLHGLGRQFLIERSTSRERKWRWKLCESIAAKVEVNVCLGF